MLPAKPFLKWAGGKSALLQTIDSFLPERFQSEKDVTYIEPFVGGGALLFHMLQTYPGIKRAVINDKNLHLVKTYVVIKNNPYRLIGRLSDIQTSYRSLADIDSRKEFYLRVREKFNAGNLADIEVATYLIFLNRTCFNGLYRENSKGMYNVPFGKSLNPTICNADLIVADSEILQRVTILHGDFSQTAAYVDGYTFMYFDPPYRPLNATSNFNSYVKEAFNDDEQIRLKNFFDELNRQGCYLMLSNSDDKGSNGADAFFDTLYHDFYIERVFAKRAINANPARRGPIRELLIRNYADYQGEK